MLIYASERRSLDDFNIHILDYVDLVEETRVTKPESPNTLDRTEIERYVNEYWACKTEVDFLVVAR